MRKPLALKSEVKLGSGDIITSKTDDRGMILAINKKFTKISGYTEDELVGENHNCVRHPDMPKAIFALMWDTIKKGENMTTVIKNLAKSGKFYWVITDFESTLDENGKIKRYTATSRMAPKNVVDVFDPLYGIMVETEAREGLSASTDYLMSTLGEKDLNYSEFVEDIENSKNIGYKLFGWGKK